MNNSAWLFFSSVGRLHMTSMDTNTKQNMNKKTENTTTKNIEMKNERNEAKNEAEQSDSTPCLCIVG